MGHAKRNANSSTFLSLKKKGEYVRQAFKRFISDDSSGQALAEFAICLPLLITILCGILDFGWVYMNEYEVNHAAYEAARYASFHASDENMTLEILENNMTALVRENLTHQDPAVSVSFTWPSVHGMAKITITNPVHMLTYIGIFFFGSEYPITVQNAFYVRMPL